MEGTVWHARIITLSTTTDSVRGWMTSVWSTIMECVLSVMEDISSTSIFVSHILRGV